jgi:hypothetical protein
MTGITLRKGKSNGKVNIYVAVQTGDTRKSTDRVIFVPVPAGTTFKDSVAKLAG